MSFESVTMWYFIIGILIALINGFVRKIEADGLLSFAWVLLWPMTPIYGVVKFFDWTYVKVSNYQPWRRAKIFLHRNF